MILWSLNRPTVMQSLQQSMFDAPLMRAALDGKIDAVATLIDFGADPNAHTNYCARADVQWNV